MSAHQNEEHATRRPIHTERSGNIEVAVWEQENGQGTGYAVTGSRSFRRGGKWERSNQFFRNDLPVLTVLLNRTYEWFLSQENAVGSLNDRISEEHPNGHEV